MGAGIPDAPPPGAFPPKPPPLPGLPGRSKPGLPGSRRRRLLSGLNPFGKKK